MDVPRFVLAVLAGSIIASAAIARARDTMPLDEGWKFFKGDVTGAEQFDYDDSQWKTVRVPHDWSIEGPFAETNLGWRRGRISAQWRRLVSQTFFAAGQ